MKHITLFSLAFGLLLAAQPAAAQSGQVFLKLPGVVGTSTVQTHKDEIPILSFSIGVSSPETRKPGGEVCSDLAVMKVVDQTSPILFQHAAFGIDFPDGVLTFAKNTPTGPVDVFQITLKSVSITSVQLSGSSEIPTESVSLRAGSWVASLNGVTDKATLNCIQ